MTTNGTVPNVSAFVHDLVAMAKAAEELPILKAALAEETDKTDHLSEISRELQERVDSLSTKLKEVEAERDDAQYRFLEADEKANKVLDMVRGVQTVLGSTVATLAPAPEPTPEPAPVPETGPAYVYEPETGFVVETRASANETLASADIQHETEASASVEKGQSEPGPMFVATESIPGSPSVTESSVSPTSDASSPTPSQAEGIGTGTEPVASGYEGQRDGPFDLGMNESTTTESGGSEQDQQSNGSDSATSEAKPYAGLKYWELNTYISRADWLSGGGTEDDYNWHPETKWDAAQ